MGVAKMCQIEIMIGGNSTRPLNKVDIIAGPVRRILMKRLIFLLSVRCETRALTCHRQNLENCGYTNCFHDTCYLTLGWMKIHFNEEMKGHKIIVWGKLHAPDLRD